MTIDSFGSCHCLQINSTFARRAALLPMPMTELTDRTAALDDLLGAEGARCATNWVMHPAGRRGFDMAEAFVPWTACRRGCALAWIAWAFDRIAATGGRRRVASIAENIGWSREASGAALRRRSGSWGSKSVSRIVRFNRAIAGPRSGSGWAGIAADCGYADQAHMVREFRELGGELSPVSWAAARVTFLQYPSTRTCQNGNSMTRRNSDDGRASTPPSATATRQR